MLDIDVHAVYVSKEEALDTIARCDLTPECAEKECARAWVSLLVCHVPGTGKIGVAALCAEHEAEMLVELAEGRLLPGGQHG